MTSKEYQKKYLDSLPKKTGAIIDCPKCKGETYVRHEGHLGGWNEPCDFCDQTGKVPDTKVYEAPVDEPWRSHVEFRNSTGQNK